MKNVSGKINNNNKDRHSTKGPLSFLNLLYHKETEFLYELVLEDPEEPVEFTVR